MRYDRDGDTVQQQNKDNEIERQTDRQTERYTYRQRHG